MKFITQQSQQSENLYLSDWFKRHHAKMRRIALKIILLYKRYLSPRKGFACAYRIHTGRCSCSTLGYRAIRAKGVWVGMNLIFKRTYRCGVAHRRFSRPASFRHAGQRGACDLACDFPCDAPCHISAADFVGGACDFANCCNCGCDIVPEIFRRHRGNDGMVHIPPKPRRPVQTEGADLDIRQAEKPGSSAITHE